MTPRRWRAHSVSIVLIVIGIAIRLRAYLFCRSLWLDEAMLAVSIAARSPIALLKPLEYNQNAPILFLWLAKACTWLFGVNELALRAVSEASGYLVLIALTVAAHRRFGWAAGVVCASLASLSPALARFANEAKPYGSDALATSLLIVAYCSLDPAFSRTSARVMGGLGVFCVLLSNPSVFVVAAVWIALAWTHRLNPSTLRRVVLSVLPSLTTFAVLYFAVVGNAAANELVRAGYRTGFLPPSGDSAALLPLMISGTFFPAFAGDGTGMPGISAGRAALFVALFLAAVTVATWRREGGAFAIVLGAPVVFAFVGATLGLYPVGVPRLMAFQFPCVILAASGAIARLWPPAAPQRLNRLGLVLWLLLLWPMWANAWASWTSPFRGDDFRGAYEQYSSIQLGEPVYIGAKAQPAWLFYSTNWDPATRRQKELFETRRDFYFAAGGRGESFENRASRGRAVLPDEGRDVVFDFRGRLEVLGISTGRQWRWPGYVSGVDQGWPEHEADRLLAAAAKAEKPCEWIVVERLSELTYRPLRDSLRFEHNGRTHQQISFPGVTIGQVCH